ncbi:MAG: hypothetical protein M8364_09410 [Methylobacter sp.]|uniref:hypothetical protein n=1 Tax=Methylobacter sp. TaxID=2051955 RepID=UPI0025877CAC|nr:hypothetical protein [Methylobacter sp.]MCL7421106.1 hypothetical protein [Methylobacter sp.]
MIAFHASKRYSSRVVVGCAERKAKRISRERCASRCSAHPTSCLVSKGKAEEKLQALKAYLFPSNNFTGSIKACFEAHKVGQLLLKRLASFAMAA